LANVGYHFGNLLKTGDHDGFERGMSIGSRSELPA
jgi:hypothetical protein